MSIASQMFQAGMQQLVAYSGEEITYSRQPHDVQYTFIATPGNALATVDGIDVVGVAATNQDFIFKVSNISELGLPEANDQIIWKDTTYQVIDANFGTVFSFMDQSQTYMRVHTQSLGAQDEHS